MLRPKTKRMIGRLIPFGLIWVVSGWIFLVVELAATNSFQELPVTAIKVDIELFVFSSFALLIVGLLMGFMELKYLDHVFNHKNFAVRLLYKLLIYGTFFFIIILIIFPIAASLELDTSVFDEQVWRKYWVYFNSLTHLSTILQLAISLILSLFYSEISEFIGRGVLLNFFTGKYHSPIEEERTFMFLDMKSSTTIAEQLGHVEYFKLLRAYYDCFSDAIVDHEGEIYQYVGDEIILSWTSRGDQKDNRCIDCFFAMKESLRSKEKEFKKQFGWAPTFKAGIHVGKVTIGEIGDIKKDIMFTGDVLNATARIQGLCNTYNADLLVSVEMLDRLNLNQSYAAQLMGVAELRGKEERKELYGIEKNG